MVNIEKHLIEVEACRKDHIMRDNTFTVAVLEQAYEVAKELQKYRASKIEVGDVVVPEKGVAFVVTYISSDEHLFGITATGDTYTALPMKYCQKTDKHIDIKSVLEQIGE